MRYKIQIVCPTIEFNYIYRENIITGLKIAYDNINQMIKIIEERDLKNDIKIIIKEPEIVKAKYFSKGQRSKYNTIKELTFDELISEVKQ